MTITRDGKEIELTSRELYDAYFEQQHLFDLEEVDAYFGLGSEWAQERYGLTEDDVKSAYERIARRYRKYLDNDDGWLYAMEGACEYILADVAEEKGVKPV